jgi:alkyldihydroxyacetonephosphate synthase
VNVRRHKHWGWGFEDQQPSREDLCAAAGVLAAHLDLPVLEVEDPVPLERVKLDRPRVIAPAELAEIARADDHARACHAWGKSYSDVVRGFRGQFDHPPDFVAYPRDETEVERVLEWCSAQRVAAIPYGGGTSVVGGVQPEIDPSYNGAVSLDMRSLNRVLEVDSISRSARIQGGALGPGLEAQLAEHSLTLRHFPQSFEFSTLGGWIATRAAGHFATLFTHIEDLVESVRAITPIGVWQSRRLPGSGAGVSPDRMLIGSEGTLGVITEAWMKVQPRPDHRSSVGVGFVRFEDGVACVRAISQAGLHPSNCRLIDAAEARLTMAGDGSFSLLVLGFESTDHEVEESMARALQICREHGGDVKASKAGSADSVGSWREAFLGAPYMRDTFVALGVLAETFETSITWERFPTLHERIMAAALAAVKETSTEGRGGQVSCRFTHLYPDGPAAYYTVIAPANRGEEVAQWAHIKRAVSDAIISCGATITHHHAVGRDHRPWYDEQRPEPFAAALRGAKAALDPGAIMNPGVLVDSLS